MSLTFSFDNSYARLPERFFSRLPPTPVPFPKLIKINEALAASLGLNSKSLETPKGIDILAGNSVPLGAEPLAMAYAGHQFGNWVPQLGDGRAILLGEVIDNSGDRWDVQLKGAGPTPFSRMGDGRAVLGPILREYLVSEAMANLRIPTTRTLAAISTGENIQRETVLPGAILTRIARSHIRIGTFQFFYSRKDFEALRLLADHVICRHYSEIKLKVNPYKALFDSVVCAQANLLAKWQLVGFIHGVMNTDNSAISGETIDYGPCAFMDAYHPDTVFSSIDHMGRYSYKNQPAIAKWNLACFAETLIPLFDGNINKVVAEFEKSLEKFEKQFEQAYLSGLRSKLGLVEEMIGDLELGQDLLRIMAANNADYTQTFRNLCVLDIDDLSKDSLVGDLFVDPRDFDNWARNWRKRLRQEKRENDCRKEAMSSVNPAYIPRNHRIAEAIKAAVHENDLEPFYLLNKVLENPFTTNPGFSKFAEAPQLDEVVTQTFCGT